MSSSTISKRLETASPAAFTLWAMGAAFATYFCMYGLRKPFAAAEYPGTVGGVEYKTLFIIMQVFGYAASKFIGIKVVSELPGNKRAYALLATLGIAELALVLFAIIPAPYNALALVLNGLPLGMIWGLVFGFLEGRRTSDMLGAGLCGAFIVASGVTKASGLFLLGAGVPLYWMPAATGALFLGPMVFFVWMLAQIPPPSAQDEAERTKRAPMNSEQRWSFFMASAPGLVALVLAYIALSAYRDFRDNFATEIWAELGYAESPEVLAAAEVPVAVGALVAVALIVLVKDNRIALLVIHGAMALGAVLVAVTTGLMQAGLLDPAAWMICVGLGLYIGYVPFNCILFDRLIAALGSVATAGFLIYVADSFGYLGSVGLMLYKDFGQADLNFLEFFIGFSWVTAALSVVLFGASALYFWRKTEPAT